MGGELHFGWVLGGPGNPSHLGRSRARAAGRRPAASAPSRYKAKAIGTMNAACASSQPSMFVVITVGKPAPLKSACSRCTRADLVPSAQGRSPRARPARLASLRLSCTSFEVAGPARPRAVPGEDSPRTHSFERCRPLGAAPTVQVRNGWHGGYERDGAVGVPRDHVGDILDSRWRAWFDGLHLASDSAGQTTIAGPVADQTALHGVLARIGELGLPARGVPHRTAMTVATAERAAVRRLMSGWAGCRGRRSG